MTFRTEPILYQNTFSLRSKSIQPHFFLKVLNASRRFSWRPESKFGRFKFVMLSLCNPAGFWTGPASAPKCLSVAAEKFITGYYSRHENSSEFAHIVKKKKNAGKNYKNTGSGLGAKLHEQYYVSTRFHAHSQTHSKRFHRKSPDQ